MLTEDELRATYESHAKHALPPIAQDAAALFGLTTEEDLGALGVLLARAFLAGANAGESEVMAQAISRGVNLRVSQLGRPA